ncbi:MAG: twin-arginine translocase TatA/TatE family subunit [Nitrospinota bacterium]
MFGFGLFEILLVLGIILLLVGGKRLPEVGSGLAKAIKGFKRSMRETDEIDVTPQGGKKDPPASSAGRDESEKQA